MGGGYTNKIRIYSVSVERQEGVGQIEWDAVSSGLYLTMP